MQVKKFEARSMKEALEMIKTQLGPDAIILSAKEITRSFGLGGEKSIEVTAAYSETTLQKKKFVESKLPEHEKEKFQHIPAKKQKEVMQKMIEKQIEKMNSQLANTARSPKVKTNNTIFAAGPKLPYRMTERRYIDIDDESQASSSVETTNSTKNNMNISSVTDIAKKAWNNMEVSSLKEEIESLKAVIGQFKNIPQNFVQPHPGAEHGVHYQMSEHYQRLTQAGLLPDIAGKLVALAQMQMGTGKNTTRSIFDAWLARHFLDEIQTQTSVKEQFHIFVGPSGSGKTSSLIKLASELIIKQQKKIAIISTDVSKVGAAEQMKIFAQILNVPFLSIRSQQDWAHVIPHLDQLDSVLVDFAGFNLRNQEEIHYMKRMSPPVFRSVRTHLVLSCLAKDADLLDCAKRYEAFGYDDVIFTGLDEAAQHGNIYNLAHRINIKLFAFGIGPKVPEDFEMATAERVVDLILKITQSSKQEVSV